MYHPATSQAQEDLGQEASAVSEISLNHAVRQAISASNAKYDDDDIVDRVRARKNKAFGGKSGGHFYGYILRCTFISIYDPDLYTDPDLYDILDLPDPESKLVGKSSGFSYRTP